MCTSHSSLCTSHSSLCTYRSSLCTYRSILCTGRTCSSRHTSRRNSNQLEQSRFLKKSKLWLHCTSANRVCMHCTCGFRLAVQLIDCFTYRSSQNTCRICSIRRSTRHSRGQLRLKRSCFMTMFYVVINYSRATCVHFLILSCSLHVKLHL